MEQKKATLTGLEKTAILMNVLGKEKSYELMKGMKDADLRNLLQVMGSMKRAPISLINSVLKEFLYRLSETNEIIFDDSLTSPEAISEGLGEERAKQIFGDIKATNFLNRRHLTVLDSVDPKTLAQFLLEEHPQTAAIVISHLDVTKQVGIIKNLPEGVRSEIIIRLANLESISPEKIEELDEVLKIELTPKEDNQKTASGITSVAELINGLDKKTMNALMTRLEERDPILTEEIRQYIFTFTDIIKIDDRGIQLILREVPNDKLLLALKSSPEEIREKVFSSMSERASEMLREDLSALGPQKVSDVEGAQREIVKIIKKLEEQGKIVIGIGEDSEVIP